METGIAIGNGLCSRGVPGRPTARLSRTLQSISLARLTVRPGTQRRSSRVVTKLGSSFSISMAWGLVSSTDYLIRSIIRTIASSSSPSASSTSVESLGNNYNSDTGSFSSGFSSSRISTINGRSNGSTSFANAFTHLPTSAPKPIAWDHPHSRLNGPWNDSSEFLARSSNSPRTHLRTSQSRPRKLRRSTHSSQFGRNSNSSRRTPMAPSILAETSSSWDPKTKNLTNSPTTNIPRSSTSIPVLRTPNTSHQKLYTDGGGCGSPTNRSHGLIGRRSSALRTQSERIVILRYARFFHLKLRLDLH